MYRQYEDPRTLEKRLEEAENRLEEARALGIDTEYIEEEVAELRDRVNFAWQDEEYNCGYDPEMDYIWD